MTECRGQPNAACLTYHDRLDNVDRLECSMDFQGCEVMRGALSQQGADVEDVSTCEAWGDGNGNGAEPPEAAPLRPWRCFRSPGGGGSACFADDSLCQSFHYAENKRYERETGRSAGTDTTCTAEEHPVCFRFSGDGVSGPGVVGQHAAEWCTPDLASCDAARSKVPSSDPSLTTCSTR
ncbi:MAG: hypothetical protein U0414_03120 [Polyangiaceae bacterium]